MTTATTQTKLPSDKMILEDRPCSTCGYNLKGLRTGTKCPECGAEIRAVSRLHEDDMGDAPRAYLAILSTGFIIMSISGFVALAAMLSLFLDAVLTVGSAATGYGGTTGLGILRSIGFPGACIAWGIGVQIVTKPRPGVNGAPRLYQGKPEWGRLRTVVRTGGLALALGMTLIIIGDLSGLGALGWIGYPLFIAGLIGVIPLCVYLSNLAHWASDTYIAMHLMYTGVTIGILGPICALFFTPFVMIVGIFTVPIAMCVAGALIWLMVLILKMSSMVQWSIKNAKFRVERDARLAEKARQHAEDTATRSGYTHRTGDDADPHLLATIERQNAASQQHREGREDAEPAQRQDIPKHGHTVDSSDADPYALEDD